ncbi:hypothetical protein JHK85_005901 [Glycine max]|nr:hypothetical protein JHK87_005590 [Glycine soja]KAG5064718.1 hypothetical protein JHK85_005901 [Glycine max]
MIGTKAIIAIKRSDGTWGMDTHTTSPRRPENACSPLPSKIAFVTNKSVANMNTMNARILVLPSDVYKLSWVFGFQMLAFRLKPKVTDGYRKYWNMYHHFLRYGLLAITYCYIFKGINILEGGDAKHNAFA